MQLPKFLKLMSMVTILALTYIHMQMQIVDLAYQGNKKERRIRQLVEENGRSAYKVLTLKSANHLGVAMLEKGSDMQFADANDIIQIAASEEFLIKDQLGRRSGLTKNANPLLGSSRKEAPLLASLRDFLFFGTEAEARVTE